MKTDDGRIENVRILITDDNAAIHEDFRRILATSAEDDASLSEAENLLFGDPAAPPAHHPAYALDFALQGQQAVQWVKRARADGRPYALAFVDMRMPPGWDGLETIEQLWKEDPDVQIVICSAHSDYDWRDIFERLGHSDKLLILKKPFEPIEVLQCASALSRKWQHERALEAHVESLEQVGEPGRQPDTDRPGHLLQSTEVRHRHDPRRDRDGHRIGHRAPQRVLGHRVTCAIPRTLAALLLVTHLPKAVGRIFLCK